MENDISTSVLTKDQQNKFFLELNKLQSWYNRGRRNWSIIHNSTVYLSILFTAIAALLPQLKGIGETTSNNITTVFASLGAVLIGLNKAGAFEKKWRVNRISYSKIHALSNELILKEPTAQHIEQLNKISIEHDSLIVNP